jgi:hypothetical protein
MNIKTEEKVISTTHTFVKLDNVDCEVDELLEILRELDYREVRIRKDLSKKLIELKVVEKGRMSESHIRRGDKFDSFHKKITGIHKKSQIKKFAS